MPHRLTFPSYCLGLLMAATPFILQANDEYHLSQPSTPEQIEPYSTTVYATSPFEVVNMVGRHIVTSKDTITNFALNPAGTSILAVMRPKKGNTHLNQYLTSKVDKKFSSYDSKHLGIPVSAVFTRDARRIIIATDKDLQIVDAKKMHPLSTIPLNDFVPTSMTVSPNDFLLAISDGNSIEIYNLQTETFRKRLDISDVNVTDMVFTPDSKKFGVLTDDGLLTLFDTRSLGVDAMIDNLDEGIAFDFNENGKYIGVVLSDGAVGLVNLLKPRDRKHFVAPEGGIRDVSFIKDASGKSLLVYGSDNMINAVRLKDLEPYFAKLVSDEVDMKMTEWLKMQPGESMEAYRERLADDAVSRQRRLFEDEISTRLAGENLAMQSMSLGNYNRDKELLALEFSDMPTIYLPVPQSNIQAFYDVADIELTDVQYGLLPDDSFEIIYAVIKNKKDGKSYVYDNKDRVTMSFLDNDNVVSLDVLQQQQMEVMRLEEIKERVVAEARHDNVISENTNISVDSRVTPDYNADGERIVNYTVKFTYEVAPGFSATEDFGPGLYHINESGAAQSMLSIVKQAFEGDFAQYVKPGANLVVNIYGTADATPIIRGIAYDGTYGEYENEPIYQDGTLTGISVNKAEGISTNEQLAFLRALGVKEYMENNIEGLNTMNADYRYNISVSPDRGSEHRRITIEFTFVDVF